MATHSSILAWRIPWTEEPGGLQSVGSQSWTQLKRLSKHTPCEKVGVGIKMWFFLWVLLKSQRSIHTTVKANTCLSRALLSERGKAAGGPRPAQTSGHTQHFSGMPAGPWRPPSAASQDSCVSPARFGHVATALHPLSTFLVRKGQERPHSKLSPDSLNTNQAIRNVPPISVWFYLIIWVAPEDVMFF